MPESIKPLFLLLAAELAVLGLFVFLTWICCPKWMASIAIGGLVFFIPNTYFTLYAFPHTGPRSQGWFLNGFYRGQSGKLSLVAAGFALSFHFVDSLHMPSFFVAFCAMLIAHILVTAIWSGRFAQTQQDR